MTATMTAKQPFRMEFEMSTIKHLGLQMYSTLPPVIGELVANAWDANATGVTISIPETPVGDESEIVITDDGIGMSDSDIRRKYLIVGRDRRDEEKSDRTPPPLGRPIMGRKGIGKFSAFGIAREIEIESVHDGQTSHFIMNYDEMLKEAQRRQAEFRPLAPTRTLSSGTRITLRSLTKFRKRRISLPRLRRGLARRFAIVGREQNFEVVVNEEPISAEERDLKRLVCCDADGRQYLWEFTNEEIEPDTGWTVSGWIGALERTTRAADGIDRGVSIMARGKMVQEPFEFHAEVGQQFALSYLVGEIHADFVDEAEDLVGTSRNTLVWDADPNRELMQWGRAQMMRIAREWTKRRGQDNRRRVEQHEAYLEFSRRAEEAGNGRAKRLADQLLKKTIEKNPTAEVSEFEPLIRTCTDFVEFSAFWEITEELMKSDLVDIQKVFGLFREWQIVEAKEMARVTKGRIEAINRLQTLVEENAVEVPTLHNFLKEFPWVIDPKWTLVDDEATYSSLLRTHFPEDQRRPERDRRIDFLCVRESTNLVVVEIKRPGMRVSMKELAQIEEYVSFVRHHVKKTTDPETRYDAVVGYLLCGDVVEHWNAREKVRNLADARIYVRRYRDLLEIVKKMHRDFLDRYDQLKSAAGAGGGRQEAS